MEIAQFLAHHDLAENPFSAEEARYDPIFFRLVDHATPHQDFPKILGDIERPSTAVVFGEKGSGKTAIRLMIEKRVAEHNGQRAQNRTYLVAYDDLNPVLDRVVQKQTRGMSLNKASKQAPEKLLGAIRLQDHQDAILSLAVTKLVDGVLGESAGNAASASDSASDPCPLPADVTKRARAMPRHLRVDLALMAALYDQPRSGTVAARWMKLRRKLGLGWLPAVPWFRWFNIALTAVAVLAWGALRILSWGEAGPPAWLAPLMWGGGIAAVALWCVWCWSRYIVWSLAQNIGSELLAVQRNGRDLIEMLLQFKGSDLASQPWPVPGVQGEHDARFQLTHKLLTVLEPLGYRGLMVLCDRVDEPSLVSGRPECMKAVIWPMFDHKFLQQDRVGIKLLLPIELRHLLHRESPEFFQQSRLDKQNLIDRLTWSGATLYDMCTNRMRACRRTRGAAGGVGFEAGTLGPKDAEALGLKTPMPAGAPGARESQGAQELTLTLRDLFAQDVSKQQLVDALDQMHQPRDAFKFLYAVMQEHCKLVPQDEAEYLIPRLTLEGVRRQQSQRVMDLQRGMAPA